MKNTDELIESMPSLVEEATNNSVLAGFRGSLSTNVHDGNLKDIDAFGIYVPSLQNLLGIEPSKGSQGTLEIKQGNWDYVGYTLQKFARMAVKGNLNALSLLFLQPDHYIHVPWGGDVLLDNRDLFLSQNIYTTVYMMAYSVLNKYDSITTSQVYQTVLQLKMARELLSTGACTVFREDDRDELLAIKRGELSKSQIREIVADLQEKLNAARRWTELPEHCDLDAINELLITITLTEHEIEF